MEPGHLQTALPLRSHALGYYGQVLRHTGLADEENTAKLSEYPFWKDIVFPLEQLHVRGEESVQEQDVLHSQLLLERLIADDEQEVQSAIQECIAFCKTSESRRLSSTQGMRQILDAFQFIDSERFPAAQEAENLLQQLLSSTTLVPVSHDPSYPAASTATRSTTNVVPSTPPPAQSAPPATTLEQPGEAETAQSLCDNTMSTLATVTKELAELRSALDCVTCTSRTDAATSLLYLPTPELPLTAAPLVVLHPEFREFYLSAPELNALGVFPVTDKMEREMGTLAHPFQTAIKRSPLDPPTRATPDTVAYHLVCTSDSPSLLVGRRYDDTPGVLRIIDPHTLQTHAVCQQITLQEGTDKERLNHLLLGERLVALLPAAGPGRFAALETTGREMLLRVFQLTTTTTTRGGADHEGGTETQPSFRALSSAPLTFRRSKVMQLSLADGSTTTQEISFWPKKCIVPGSVAPLFLLNNGTLVGMDGQPSPVASGTTIFDITSSDGTIISRSERGIESMQAEQDATPPRELLRGFHSAAEILAATSLDGGEAVVGIERNGRVVLRKARACRGLWQPTFPFVLERQDQTGFACRPCDPLTLRLHGATSVSITHLNITDAQVVVSATVATNHLEDALQSLSFSGDAGIDTSIEVVPSASSSETLTTIRMTARLLTLETTAQLPTASVSLTSKEDALDLLRPLAFPVHDMHEKDVANAGFLEEAGAVRSTQLPNEVGCWSWSWAITDQGELDFGVERRGIVPGDVVSVAFRRRPDPTASFVHRLECSLVTARFVATAEETYFEVIVMPPSSEIIAAVGTPNACVCETTSSYRVRVPLREGGECLYVRFKGGARAKRIPSPITPASPFFLHSTLDDFASVQLKSPATQVVGGGHHALILTERGSVWAVGSNAFGQCGKSLAYRGLRLRTTKCDREGHQVYPDEMKRVCVACARSREDPALETSRDTAIYPGEERAKIAASACVRCHRCAECCTKGRLHVDTCLSSLDTQVPLTRLDMPFQRAAQVAAGRYHTVILSTEGVAYACGLNNGNQLGRITDFDYDKSDFGQHCKQLPFASDELGPIRLPDSADMPVLLIDARGDATLLLSANGQAVVYGNFLPTKCVDLAATMSVNLPLSAFRPLRMWDEDSILKVYLGDEKQLVALAQEETLQWNSRTRVMGALYDDYNIFLIQDPDTSDSSSWSIMLASKTNSFAPQQTQKLQKITFKNFEPVSMIPNVPVVCGWRLDHDGVTILGVELRRLNIGSLLDVPVSFSDCVQQEQLDTLQHLNDLLYDPFLLSRAGADIRLKHANQLANTIRSAGRVAGVRLRSKPFSIHGKRYPLSDSDRGVYPITVTVTARCLLDFVLVSGAVLVTSVDCGHRFVLDPNVPYEFTVVLNRQQIRAKREEMFSIHCASASRSPLISLTSDVSHVLGIKAIFATELTPLNAAILSLESFSNTSSSIGAIGAYATVTTLHDQLTELASQPSLDRHKQCEQAIATSISVAELIVHFSALNWPDSRCLRVEDDIPDLMQKCCILLAERKAAATGFAASRWQQVFEQAMNVLVAITPRQKLLRTSLEQFSRLRKCPTLSMQQVAEADVVAYTINMCWGHLSADELFQVLGITDLMSSNSTNKLGDFFRSFFALADKTDRATQRQLYAIVSNCLVALVESIESCSALDTTAEFVELLLTTCRDQMQLALASQQPRVAAEDFFKVVPSVLGLCSAWTAAANHADTTSTSRLLQLLITVFKDVAAYNRHNVSGSSAFAADHGTDLLGAEAFGRVSTIESEHPYVGGRVERKRIVLHENEPCVVAIGFHDSCSLGSPDDRLLLLNTSSDGPSEEILVVDKHNEFPSEFVVTSARELTFVLESCTRETNDADAAFGYRCQVVTFEQSHLNNSTANPNSADLESQLADIIVKLCKQVLGDVNKAEPDEPVALLPLTFNPQFHGSHAEIEDRPTALKDNRIPGQVARRPEGHNYACCFSYFPIAAIDGRKEFTVEITTVNEAKAGGLAMGFVIIPNFEDPSEKAPLRRLFPSIPSSAILVNENSLVYVAGAEAYKGNNNLGSVSSENNVFNLTHTKVGEKTKMWISKTGEMFVQGPQQKEPAKVPIDNVDFNRDVYAFVDVYGSTQGVKLSGMSQVKVMTDSAYPTSASCPCCKTTMVMTQGYTEVTCEYGQEIPFGGKYMVCPKCVTTASLSGAFAIQQTLATTMAERLVPLENVGFGRSRPHVYTLGKTFDRGLLAWELQLLSEHDVWLGVYLPHVTASKPLGTFLNVTSSTASLQHAHVTLKAWSLRRRTMATFTFVLDCGSNMLTIAERNGSTQTLQVLPGSQPCIYLEDVPALSDHIRLSSIAWSFAEPDEESAGVATTSMLVSQRLGAMNAFGVDDNVDSAADAQYARFSEEFLNATPHTQGGALAEFLKASVQHAAAFDVLSARYQDLTASAALLADAQPAVTATLGSESDVPALTRPRADSRTLCLPETQWRACRALLQAYWWHHDQADDILDSTAVLPLQEIPAYNRNEAYLRHYEEAEPLSALAECNTSCLVHLFSKVMKARLLAHVQAPSSFQGLVGEISIPHATMYKGIITIDPTCDESVIVPATIVSSEPSSLSVRLAVPILDRKNELVNVSALTPLKVFPVGTAQAHGLSVSFPGLPEEDTQLGWPEYLALTGQSPFLSWMTDTSSLPVDLVSLQVFVGLELASFTCIVPREAVRRAASLPSVSPLHRLVDDAAFAFGQLRLLKLEKASSEECQRLVDICSELLSFEPALASHSLSALQHPLVPEDSSALQRIEQFDHRVVSGSVPRTTSDPWSPRRPGMRRLSSVDTPSVMQTTSLAQSLDIEVTAKDLNDFFEEVLLLLARIRPQHRQRDWASLFGATKATVSPWTSIAVLNFLARTTTRTDVLATVMSSFAGFFSTSQKASSYYEDDEAAEALMTGEERRSGKRASDGGDAEVTMSDNGGHHVRDDKDDKAPPQQKVIHVSEQDDANATKEGEAELEAEAQAVGAAGSKKRKLTLLDESVNVMNALDLGHGLELRASRRAIIQFLCMVAQLGISLPTAHPMQRLAIRCWALPRVAEAEPILLQNTQVLSWLSRLLLMDQRTQSPSAVSSPSRGFRTISERSTNAVTDPQGLAWAVKHEEELDVTQHATVSVSSRPDMAASLVDGRTDTMWQSSGGYADNWIKFKVDLAAVNKEHGIQALPSTVYVHIDPTRDPRDKVPTSIKLSSSSVAAIESPGTVHVPSGATKPLWITLPCPTAASPSSGASLPAQFELKLSLQGGAEVRVRQVRICCRKPVRQLSNEAIQGHPIHCDALALFKLLSAGLLKSDARPLMSRRTEADEQLLGLLNREASLQMGPLQSQMLKHIVRGLRVETAALVEACCSAPMERHLEDSHATDAALTLEQEAEGRDEYILELLGLLQTALPRSATDSMSQLVRKLLYQLLHCGSVAIQRASISLLKALSPLQSYSSLSRIDATSFTGSSLSIPHAHMVLSAVAKLIQIQLRVRLPEGGSLFASPQQLSLKQLCGVEEQMTPLPLSRQTSMDVNNKALDTDSDTLLLSVAHHVKEQVSSWQVTGDCFGSMKDIIGLVTFYLRQPSWQKAVADELAALLLDLNKRASLVEGTLASTYNFFGDYSTWLAAAALAVLTKPTVDGINKAIRALEGNTFLCDHHDDGLTAAAVHCPTCNCNLCHYCDKFTHINPSKRFHERRDLDQMETLSVEWNDGYARIKQASFLILVDPVNLRGIVEFRPSKKEEQADVKQCRFCLARVDDVSPSASPADIVCSSEECQMSYKAICPRVLSCGHPCQGVKGEVTCPPCLHCGKASGLIQQDADDECMVCFCGCLREGPCLMLGCGHIFHSDCIIKMLETGWPGPRITFDFATCPLCRTSLLQGDQNMLLAEALKPIQALYQDVRRKALMRLQYDNESVEGNENAKAARAMKKYTYYKCYRCKKAYFGGEEACAVGSNEFDEKELVCPACSGGSTQQVCPKHGTDFLEYKCRYCCSVAVFFCFGTTHFCQPCHDDYQRCLDRPKSELPKCPAGPKLTQLEGDECPLHVAHPPTGEEFALGCGICRNAQTF
eukprot:m.225465 g.225465  ORF g.225465 m.225465 type:complete len:4069 (-) comp17042_c0_seq1:290-12496(-)